MMTTMFSSDRALQSSRAGDWESLLQGGLVATFRVVAVALSHEAVLRVWVWHWGCPGQSICQWIWEENRFSVCNSKGPVHPVWLEPSLPNGLELGLSASSGVVC